ncbi:unnamed protein product, partial [marine sediment metagenome]
KDLIKIEKAAKAIAEARYVLEYRYYQLRQKATGILEAESRAFDLQVKQLSKIKGNEEKTFALQKKKAELAREMAFEIAEYNIKAQDRLNAKVKAQETYLKSSLDILKKHAEVK